MSTAIREALFAKFTAKNNRESQFLESCPISFSRLAGGEARAAEVETIAILREHIAL